jgi:hypothetical protein
MAFAVVEKSDGLRGGSSVDKIQILNGMIWNVAELLKYEPDEAEVRALSEICQAINELKRLHATRPIREAIPERW